MSAQLHLCITCGGTGGHFFPGLSIASEARRRGHRVTLVIAGHHTAEQLALAQRDGFDAFPARAIRAPTSLLTAATFPFLFTAACRNSWQLLGRLHPDAVLSMGSFASVPPGLAAAARHIPLFLHDGNARIGRANRHLTRWACLLCTSFPDVEPNPPVRCPLVYTGFPVRAEIVAAAAAPSLPAEYLNALDLSTKLPLLLVFGGSQGARFLNELLPAVATMLGPETCRRFQLLHLTGQPDNQEVQDQYRNAGLRAVVKARETAMHAAYQAASLVLCRAGASTVSELALFGKPAILVPLPTAADDHQTANAQIAVHHGGAILMPQATLTPASLTEPLQAWLDHPERFAALGTGIRRIGNPEAAGSVVARLERGVEAARKTAAAQPRQGPQQSG